MAEFTKEQLISEVHYNLEHCFCSEKTKRLMEIALEALTACVEQDPVLYAAEETLAYAKMGELHLKCLSQPMGDAVIPLYTAPPAPVSVPAAMEMDDDFDSAFEHGKAVGWNAYRAAMLQAEPVSNSDELPLDYLQGHKDGLEWAAQLAEANHPQTGDWLYDDPIDLARAIRKGPDMPTVQGGNSPVIPDGWVMVPVEPTIAILDEFDSIIDYGAEDSKDAWSRLLAAAWIKSLPAAPRQEVNRG
ncbi:hypothetical protein ABT411_01615 [Escherichia coli]